MKQGSSGTGGAVGRGGCGTGGQHGREAVGQREGGNETVGL